MPEQKSIVYIVDDDSSVLRGLKRLVDSFGYETRVFSSSAEFLATALPGPDSCLIIDVAMPEMDGFELQAELVSRTCKAPVIFITAQGDPGLRSRAKRAGASGFFQKPVDADALLDAIKWAMTGNER